MRLREMESRMRMTESEVRGNFDPTQFGKPDMFRDVNRWVIDQLNQDGGRFAKSS